MNFLDFNNDGHVNLDDIYFIITDLMKEQQDFKISGKEKKSNVLVTLKSLIGEDLYIKFEPVLSPAIEFILSVAHNKRLLKHFKKTCLSCK